MAIITWASTLEIEHDAKYPSQYYSTGCFQVALHDPQTTKAVEQAQIFYIGWIFSYGDQISYHPSCFSTKTIPCCLSNECRKSQG
ncbi:uncharacterized protein B0T23DRAFT_368958 [Neurospora hispaniola]|uniref:Uncharacterized protein n=1 Tax=Neurospora hispaniola TaxID=588809 RepID=A0AAJ0MV70_9PEZI|nr:hypothetical protein B0T23DRAFT_368958 [Neurospora hispaniola]